MIQIRTERSLTSTAHTHTIREMGRISSVSSTSFVLLTLGCGQQTSDPPNPDLTEGGWLSTGATEPGAGDQALDDTAGVYGTDTDDVLGNGCFLEAQEGYFGYMHQCEGVYEARLYDNTVGLVAEWPLGADGFFGPSHEDYDSPDVMACCDVYDPGDPTPPPQPHLVSCYYNLAFNLCQTLEAHVESAYQDFTGVDGLANYVGGQTGQDDCIQAFVTELETWDVLDPPLTVQDQLDVIWPMPEYGTIDMPHLEVTALIWDVHVPENPNDYIECSSYEHNDGVSLLELNTNAEHMLVLDQGDGVLVGPTYNSIPMAGNPEFSSNDTSCSEPLCSRVHFSENSTNWTVHNISLHSANSVEITDGYISYVADWYRIELVQEVEAAELATEKFQIAAGEAYFLLSGDVEGVSHHLTATNASAITIEKRSGEWVTYSFALRYTDSENDDWTLSVGGANWVAPG